MSIDLNQKIARFGDMTRRVRTALAAQGVTVEPSEDLMEWAWEAHDMRLTNDRGVLVNTATGGIPAQTFERNGQWELAEIHYGPGTSVDEGIRRLREDEGRATVHLRYSNILSAE